MSIPAVGDRIEMVRMADDPDPIPAGTQGTVRRVQDISMLARRAEFQVDVVWDNGRSLSVLLPVDQIRVLS